MYILWSLPTSKCSRRMKSLRNYKRQQNSDNAENYSRSRIVPTISERTILHALYRMRNGSQRQIWIPLLSAADKIGRRKFVQEHKNCTMNKRQQAMWSDKSCFQLHHVDRRMRIWQKQHERIWTQIALLQSFKLTEAMRWLWSEVRDKCFLGMFWAIYFTFMNV